MLVVHLFNSLFSQENHTSEMDEAPSGSLQATKATAVLALGVASLHLMRAGKRNINLRNYGFGAFQVLSGVLTSVLALGLVDSKIIDCNASHNNRRYCYSKYQEMESLQNI